MNERQAMSNHERHAHESSMNLIACSLCLRVYHDSAWVEAERAIRKLRTYDRPAAVRLEPGICDTCSDHIARRRTESPMEYPLAA